MQQREGDRGLSRPGALTTDAASCGDADVRAVDVLGDDV